MAYQDQNKNSGCLGLLLPFLDYIKRLFAPKPQSLPYRLRDDFLSPNELSFYRVLVSLLGTDFVVQSKVRLADIFFVAQQDASFSHFNRISQRHLDFLVCDSATMRPVLGIELDDSSHDREDRKERDRFVDSVFQSARFPLVRIRAQRSYNPRVIGEQIAPFLKQTKNTQVRSPQGAVRQTTPGAAAGVPLCPKCGIPMVLRTVAQGEHKGKQFYGCQNYPRCREVLPVSGGFNNTSEKGRI